MSALLQPRDHVDEAEANTAKKWPIFKTKTK
jgi:hypothetical protein